MRRVLVGMMAFAVAACGLTADFNGLDDGPGDAGDGNGGLSEAGDSGHRGGSNDPDVSAGDSDGGLNHASTSSDGTTTGVDSSVPFCASHTAMFDGSAEHLLLCADFDEPRDMPAIYANWDDMPGEVYGPDGSAETLADESVFVSSPASLRCMIGATTTRASARLVEDVPPSASHVHIEFSLLHKSPLTSSDAPIELVGLRQVTTAGVFYGIIYMEDSSGLALAVNTLLPDGGNYFNSFPLGAVATSTTFTDVQIDVTLDDAMGQVSVTHDGTKILTRGRIPTRSIPVSSSTGQMFVDLGIYANDGVAASANYDNVVIDYM